MRCDRTSRAVGPAVGLLCVAALLAGCAASATGGTGASVTAGSGASNGSAAQTPSGSALIDARCTRCHPRDRIDGAKHDRAGWLATVERMRGKGAQLSDAEAAVVIDYLLSR